MYSKMSSVSTKSLLSSSSSNVLFDKMKPSQSQSNMKYWNYAWKIGMTVILVLVISVLAYDMSKKSQERVVAVEGIYCFECTNSVNMNLTEPGLPYEKQCLETPRNVRKCLPGEICVVLQSVQENMWRVIRSCANTTKPPGCSFAIRKSNITSCFCNRDLCIK